MRANSLGGRIMGALARDLPVESLAASTSPELPGWIEHENMALPGRPARLPRSSTAGRIVAALARTETVPPATPFTPASQEAPTLEAELTILVAGQQPVRKAPKPTRAGAPFHLREPVEPTQAARLAITTVPA